MTDANKISEAADENNGIEITIENENYDIDILLNKAVDYKASDIIIKESTPPVYRINKNLYLAKCPPLTENKLDELMYQFLSDEELLRLKKGEEVDKSYEMKNKTRFRINAFLQRGTPAAAFRRIENKILGFYELTLPPVLAEIALVPRGLVLVTGTTASGKSTTLAAMLDYINTHVRKHIITIEDPIEYMHVDKKSIVTQREIGIDTKDFATALRAAMRENPDVIFVGEMRDKETVETAISATETGHLVLATLHTTDAASTISRILEFYPRTEHDAVRSQLAEFLFATVAQRLISNIDGSGVVPAVEIMMKTPVITKLIRESKFQYLKSAIHQGRNEGMQTFDQSLVDLYQGGFASFDEAAAHAGKPTNFKNYCEGHFPDIDMGILG